MEDATVGPFTEYFEAAMRLAEYEDMEDEEGWFGTISGFEGLWAQGATEELCRAELRCTLEDWILFSIQQRMNVPAAGSVELSFAPGKEIPIEMV